MNDTKDDGIAPRPDDENRGKAEADSGGTKKEPRKRPSLAERISRTRVELEESKRASALQAAKAREANEKIAAQLKSMVATQDRAERDRLQLAKTKIRSYLGGVAIVAARRSGWLGGELLLTLEDLRKLQPEEIELIEEYFRRDKLQPN